MSKSKEKLKAHITSKNLEAKEVDGRKTVYALPEELQALLNEQHRIGWKPASESDLFKITTPDGEVAGVHLCYSPHPDSKFPILRELNKIVYEKFPPSKDK